MKSNSKNKALEAKKINKSFGHKLAKGPKVLREHIIYGIRSKKSGKDRNDFIKSLSN